MKNLSEILYYYESLRNDRFAVEVVEKAQDFRKKFIEPVAGEIDKKLLLDPRYHPEDIVKKGCEYGFLSLPIPSFLGGGNASIIHIALLMEELCAGCAGIANIFGAHYLGLSGILLAFDINIFDRFLTEIVENEKKSIPVLYSAAVTEPMAGTDVEEQDFLPKAKLVTSAKKVQGGYLLNGRKVFISNGSTAKYQLIICAIDKGRPVETWSGFLVPIGSKGFSVGRVELKMGQRACHAAELVFEDCFVPDENRIGIEGSGVALTEVVLAASRAPVAAIATGIARGAYEKALNFAKEKGIINRQWCQFALADMFSMISSARDFYIKSSLAFDNLIFKNIIKGHQILYPLLKITGPLRRTRTGKKFTGSGTFKKTLITSIMERLNENLKKLSLGLSSMAKFSCSDIAVRVCLKAMEIAGATSIEERTQIEKYLRDAKLTQIYEGTNQLNRYEVFKNMIRGSKQ